MTIYLYVKTHRKTGLKYLGKTEQDPYKYRGSGKYWKLHIKTHGYDVETEVLKECQTKEELKEWGLHYSELWNVVENDEWANLKPEDGDGGGSELMQELWKTVEFREKITKTNRKRWEDDDYRTTMSEKTKEEWANFEIRQKRIDGMKKSEERPERKLSRKKAAIEVNSRPEVIEKLKQSATSSWNDQSIRKQRIESQKIIQNRPEIKQKKSQAMKDICSSPTEKKRRSVQQSGKNNNAYDHTIYEWTHTSGICESLTKHELSTKYNLQRPNLNKVVNGDYKQHKGWSLKINTNHAQTE